MTDEIPKKKPNIRIKNKEQVLNSNIINEPNTILNEQKKTQLQQNEQDQQQKQMKQQLQQQEFPPQQTQGKQIYQPTHHQAESNMGQQLTHKNNIVQNMKFPEGPDFMTKIFQDYLEYEYINCIEESPVSAPNISNLQVAQVKKMIEGHELTKELLDWYFQAVDWCLSRDKINSLKQDVSKNNIKVFWPELVKEALQAQSLTNTALYFFLEQYLDAGFRLTNEYANVVFAHTEPDLSTYLMVMNEQVYPYYVGNNYDPSIHDRMFDLIKKYNQSANTQDSKRSDVVKVRVNKNIEILYVINRIMYMMREGSLESSYDLQEELQINEKNTERLVKFVALLMIGKLDQIFIEKQI